MALKTNAIRRLDQVSVSYQLAEYAPDLPLDKIAFSLDIEPERLFKTLVTQGDFGPVVFCLPLPWPLDLKQAARVSQNKKLTLLPQKDLLRTTGYQRGGCSPLGMKKAFPTYIDEVALVFEAIFVNAGTKGLQVCISPEDLAQACSGEFAELSQLH